MPMNPEVKAKWVAALRSGEYEQAKGVLRKADSYCCLGVLCDLSGIDTWAKDVEDMNDWVYDRFFSSLPYSVRDWAGLDSEDPQVWKDDSTQARLSDLNDSGKTFAEIADIIEREL